MQEQIVQARVSSRLLAKADRLFTGTLEGRIIEILQNARRAGASRIEITNSPDGFVTIQDNGHGIRSFSVLLDLGSSDWDPNIEEAEDPAGVGIFSLAPRDVIIESGSIKLVINQAIWTGTPARLLETHEPVPGTRIQFKDSLWEFPIVEKYAVFTGLEVIVDGKTCARQPFYSQQAVHHPELGCRIEVRPRDELNEGHRHFWTNFYRPTALVNFHGQVVTFEYKTLTGEHLCYLVDLTGEPTGLRLMLPARTCMVENAAFTQLKASLEIEAFRYIQRKGKHTLSYAEYLRARELGIELPEADPVFSVGLLSGDAPEPMGVTKPEDFPLSRCYLMKNDSEDIDGENAHILAALGQFEAPFIPVEINPCYDSYSWAKLPTIDTVAVSVHKTLGSDWLWGGDVAAYDRLEITVITSDGKRFHSPVSVAIREFKRKTCNWVDKTVCLTPQSRDEVTAQDLWFHFGGWRDDGDTFDTQLIQFEEDLERFWADILGPEGYLRDKLLAMVHGVIKTKWKTLTLEPDGHLSIQYADGTEKSVRRSNDE